MQFDLIIRKGTIVDGSGRKRCQSDIAIQESVIAEIGDLGSATGTQEIDARGKISSFLGSSIFIRTSILPLPIVITPLVWSRSSVRVSRR